MQVQSVYNNQMANPKRTSVTKKRYAQISLKKRQILVNSVIELGESLTKTAKKLKIKLSTAKLILKKFKKTGILMNKKLRNTKKETATPPPQKYPNLVIPTFDVKEHTDHFEKMQEDVQHHQEKSEELDKKSEETPAADNLCYINPFWYAQMVFPFGGQYFVL